MSALPVDTRIASLWLGLALVLLTLGIQTAITETARIMARSEGWYANRRPIQVGFILFVVLAGVWGLAQPAVGARG